ncbi:hypothetical protein GWI33_021775, partial [Rhynchophorus ferrugineus]
PKEGHNQKYKNEKDIPIVTQGNEEGVGENGINW